MSDRIKIIILGDGMADLAYMTDKDGRSVRVTTPLEEAKTPEIDALAPSSEIGLVKTVPDGMKPGSDIANLSVMGYNPLKCYTGRSPLEAVSIGVDMQENHLVLRCNLVSLGAAASGDKSQFGERTMKDYSAGEIDTETARVLITGLAEHFKKSGRNLMRDFDKGLTGFEPTAFYTGVSYRHCLVIENGAQGTDYTPPHDISGKKIGRYLPRGFYGAAFTAMIKEAYVFLSEHPLNKARVAAGKNPADCIWLWGEGKKPRLENFLQKTGKNGAVISAVDLIKGIGIAAGMKIYEVEGATGTVCTNFAGKANAVLRAVKDGCGFVYLHIEAADESGHHGNRAEKILSIEKIDGVVGVIKRGLDGIGKPYSLLILPDHPTPVSTMTHSSDPVPYLMYSSGENLSNGVACYCETAAKDGRFLASGEELFLDFMKR
ncbi:MAG: cofactor-independent phosphoglycerate mutase [Clostridiales bacterium]|jgi:2,3-bisphosphoglycerate-independent phosphoglycerate mutase|nr:cofactor-independent phosphoglycerate mutase [Clostridiales bacterium]